MWVDMCVREWVREYACCCWMLKLLHIVANSPALCVRLPHFQPRIQRFCKGGPLQKWEKSTKIRNLTHFDLKKLATMRPYAECVQITRYYISVSCVSTGNSCVLLFGTMCWISSASISSRGHRFDVIVQRLRTTSPYNVSVYPCSSTFGVLAGSCSFLFGAVLWQDSPVLSELCAVVEWTCLCRWLCILIQKCLVRTFSNRGSSRANLGTVCLEAGIKYTRWIVLCNEIWFFLLSG